MCTHRNPKHKSNDASQKTTAPLESTDTYLKPSSVSYLDFTYFVRLVSAGPIVASLDGRAAHELRKSKPNRGHLPAF